MSIIKVENISKIYDLGLVGTGTLSKDLNRAWAKLRGKPDPYAKLAELNDRTQKTSSGSVYALKDISFEVQQGEVLGIIGKNGAGKSTLLKILSQITSPTTGEIKIKGRVASLLEVGTGMHPEMTARQNIYLNGSIMGMRRHEITAKLDEIVDFAGISKYIDTPIKRFSSGMQVRLGFAVAAFLEPEILIVDEVLAVGDAEFQKKAIGKMQDVSKGEGRTVLFVSHNMAAVKRLCDTCVLIDQGKLIDKAPTSIILGKYQQAIINKIYAEYFNEEYNLKIKSVHLHDNDGIIVSNVENTKNLNFLFNFTLGKFSSNLVFGVAINDLFGNRILTAHSSDDSNFALKMLPENTEYNLSLQIPNILAPGNYIFTFGVKDEKQNLITGDDQLFTVTSIFEKRDGSEGLIWLNPKWNNLVQ